MNVHMCALSLNVPMCSSIPYLINDAVKTLLSLLFCCVDFTGSCLLLYFSKLFIGNTWVKHGP